MRNPQEPQTIVDVLDRAAIEFAEKKIGFFSAQQTGSAATEITFAQFRADVRSLAHKLRTAGVKAEMRAVVMANRNIDFLKAFGALSYCGATITPLPPMLLSHMKSDHQVHTVLNSEQIDFVVTDESNAALLSESGQAPENIYVIPTDSGGYQDGCLATPSLPHLPEIGEKELAWIQYTSGSTSSPRGVALTHKNLVAGLRAGVAGARSEPHDVMCHSLPLFHSMGLLFTLSAFQCGHDLYISTPDELLRHPENWLRKAQEFRASILGGPNAFFKYLTATIPQSKVAEYDLSAVRIILNGSESIDPNSVQQFAKHFRPARLKTTAMTPCYGLTEATLAVTCAPFDTEIQVDWVDSRSLQPGHRVEVIDRSGHKARGIVNCGAAVPGVEVRIAHDAVPLPDQVVGDVEVRGTPVMSTYYGESAPAVSEDGWLSTGDLGYLSNGCLYVTGRTKEILISAGTNYYPQDVESAVRQLPGILHENVAAVTLAPNPEAFLQERIGVVAETDSPSSAHRHIVSQIRSAAARQLNGTTVDVALIGPGGMLRTPGGKLQRLRMSEMLSAGTLPQVITYVSSNEMIS
ncbi:AMP-binding protein [Streptomyces sp. NPDC057717]|uniref:AMP-binding protein n=1 Tax=Streptomyces sp. NPDC057717 TaxID=3346224 RepID=UPI0036CE23A5